MDTPRKLPFRQALPAVLFITALFFINYTCRAIMGPLLVYLERELLLDHMQATSLLLYMASGFCVCILFSGLFLSWIAPRRVIALSALCTGLALFAMSLIDSLYMARALFTLFGFVAGLYFTAGMAALGSLSRPEDWSYTVAVHELAPPLGFIVAPVIVAYTADAWGWRATLHIMGSVAIIASATFFLWGQGGTQKTDRPSSAGVGKAFQNPIFLLFIWLLVLGIAAEFAPFSVLPLSLVSEQHLAPEAAAQLLSFTRLLSPIVVFCGGWAAAKLGARKTLALFLLVHGAALAAMALPVGRIGLLAAGGAMTLQALAPAFMFPALFTVLARAFPAGRQPMLLSLAMPIGSVMGTGLIPFLLGVCGTYLSFAQGFLLLGLINLLTLPLVLRILKE